MNFHFLFIFFQIQILSIHFFQNRIFYIQIKKCRRKYLFRCFFTKRKDGGLKIQTPLFPVLFPFYSSFGFCST